MANPSKDKGTKAETALVRFAQASGYPDADRLTLTGTFDRGDVQLRPGLIAQVKAGVAAQTASLLDVDRWLADTEKQRVTGRAWCGILVVQRRGLGLSRIGLWDCYVDAGQLFTGSANQVPVCLRVHRVLELFRPLLVDGRDAYRDPPSAREPA